jgi:methylenetetrahydrofolate reductase (NADPH)
MFFNNQKYFEFVDNCRKMDINIPIIPGIKPLTTKKQLTALPKIFHIDLPDDLVNAVDACKDDKAVKQVGIEWAIQQSKELKAGKVPVLHYYTMGVSETTKAIASQVF